MLGRFSARKPAVLMPLAPAVGNGLSTELERVKAAATVVAEATALSTQERMLDAKLRIHRRLIDEINLSSIDKIPEKELYSQVHSLVAQYVATEKIMLNATELGRFVDDILHEMTGLGPIEPLLSDESVNDILINTHKQIYIERRGHLVLSDARFKDEAHLLRFAPGAAGTDARHFADETRKLLKILDSEIRR